MHALSFIEKNYFGFSLLVIHTNRIGILKFCILKHFFFSSNSVNSDTQ